MPVFRSLSLLLFGLMLALPSNAAGEPEVPPAAAPGPAASHLAPELTAWCNRLSHELKSVHLELCLKRAWKFDLTTPGGHPIPYLLRPAEVLPAGSKPAEPARKVLIVGAIHGDEISAVSTVFRWIDFLDRTKSDSFLRQNTYLFFPLVNPDGFYASPRTRTNSNGVDINRNFSTKEWAEKATLFWKRKTASDPRRFPGKNAASEKETQMVEKAVDDFKPDLIISVHAPYKLVDHDGPISFPNLESPLPVRTLGAYPGSLGTYAGIERNIPVVTPELPNAKQLPEGKAIEQLFLFIMKSKY